jgi:hypothetical protein
MRGARPVFLLLAVVCLIGPAMAEEILYFTNGTSMPVRSHRIENGMIHVDLGGNAFMAFPENMVERIESADGSVSLPPSNLIENKNGAVQRTTSSHQRADVKTATRGRGDEQYKIIERSSSAEVETDENGVAIYRPRTNHPAKRRVGATGNLAGLGVASGQRYEGTTQMGTKHVVDTPRNPRQRGNTRTPVPVTQNSGGSKKKKSGSN